MKAISDKLLWPGVGVVVVLGIVAALFFAWKLDEAAKPVKTKVVDKVDDGSLTVDIKEQQEGDFIIYCDEGHFLDAHEYFRKFVDKNSEAVTAPGGPMLIALADFEVKEELKAPKRVLIEVLKRHSPRRIILVEHEECLIYDSIGAWRDRPDEVRKMQLEHLRRAKAVLKEWFPLTTVDIYYGEKIGKTQMRFYPVVADSVILKSPEFSSPSIELDVSPPDSSK